MIMIFKDETDPVFCFLSCLVKFLHAKLTDGGEERVRILAIECLSVFLFFSLPTVLVFFSRSNSHTHKQGRCEDTRKGQKETRAVHFTRFLEYRLMFDSGLSFSLQYFLTRPPY